MDCVYTVEKILTELAALSHSKKIAVRSRHKAYVYRLWQIATQRRHHTVLQGHKHLCLQMQRKVTYLVHK